MSEIKVGDKVQFKPGPRSKGPVTATVTGQADGYLLTKDADGNERKARPGACKKV